MIGTAARASISLGLHLRAAHNKLNAQALEARHKLWWSIFILEYCLSVMTGRDSGLGSSNSAPPPLASKDMDPFTNSAPKNRLNRLSENPPMKWTMDQQQRRLEAQQTLTRTMEATNELYFFCLTDLIVISHTASTRVYSIDALKRGWVEIRSRVRFYNRIMADWRTGLPDSLNFEMTNSGPTLSIKDGYRVSLAMHYHSSRIVLNRPCLARKKNGTSDQSHVSRASRDMEMNCLHSALAILSIFPDEPSTSWFRCVPWWSLVHFLVQATTILLIEMSRDDSRQWQPSQKPNSDSNSGLLQDHPEIPNREAILTMVRKALLWLHHLGETDNSARRAFELCNNCVGRLRSKLVGLDRLTVADNAPEASHLNVPTDNTHQQYRSRLDVSLAQFAGAGGFGYDHDIYAAPLPLESRDTESSQFAEPFIGTLGQDADMSDFIPEPEIAPLDEILQFLT